MTHVVWFMPSETLVGMSSNLDIRHSDHVRSRGNIRYLGNEYYEIDQ